MVNGSREYLNHLHKLSKLARKYILESTTKAGSGHPTSSLSAVELMVGLMFGGSFRYRLDEPAYWNNDRLIFSKGHASPLFYALWVLAGKVTEEELMSLRKFDSRLEGHPAMRFPYTEVATGSLGQGLGVGVGMAINAKYLDKLSYRTYVLLGDSEMAEGSNWEAVQLAAHYKLNNLVGIIDVNRLGQRGETMGGWDIKSMANKVEAFGWNAVMLEDGHHLSSILKAYEITSTAKEKPTMLIAKTVKGKGISFLEDKEGWHGKVLDKEATEIALRELGEVEPALVGRMKEPNKISNTSKLNNQNQNPELKSNYQLGEMVATRKAFGEALVELGNMDERVVVLDAEVGNSTFANLFQEKYQYRFFECFIAEQNMVSMATGLERRGKHPYMATFAAFWTRAFDQLRMSAQMELNLTIVGTHAGVSIGEDGGSQMGLEDIAMMRSLHGSVVMYPADGVAMNKLMMLSLDHERLMYLRATRMETPIIYGSDEEFEIGGSKVLRQSGNDKVTLIGAGVTLYECLRAHDELKENGIRVQVIDLYSIKPIDVEALVRACKNTDALIVVEDHYSEGGMVEAVRSALVYETTPVHSLAVRKMPRSGNPGELLRYEKIDGDAIVAKVEQII